MKAKTCIFCIVLLVFLVVVMRPVVQGGMETNESVQKTKLNNIDFKPDKPESELKEFLRKRLSEYALEQRDTLKGLVSFHVAIGISDKGESSKYGLTEGILRTDVERKLRTAGIMVLEDKEARLTSPRIVVGVFSVYPEIPEGKSLIAVTALTIEVQQWVAIERTPSIRCVAATWSATRVGLVGLSLYKDTVRSAVKNMVDDFLNDYLAANPKEPTKEGPKTLDELLKKSETKKQE
jgi:hypothetical protein